MSKPHIEDLFTAMEQHMQDVRQAMNERKWSREDQQQLDAKLKERLQQFGIADHFDYDLR